MKKVVVIGGGLAGISAAAYLSHNNFDVTLLEATHKLGGRTFSYIDKISNMEIDNGQHILLGCYNETINFLKLISSANTILYPEKFSLNYLFDNHKTVELSEANLFFPLNLLIGFLTFQSLNTHDKISLLKLLIKIRFTNSDIISHLSVIEWLEKEKQTKNSIDFFWKIIAVGALNSSVEKASAKMFCDILKKIFWSDQNGYRILLPKRSLNETFITPAESFLKRKNVKIFYSEKCEQIVFSNNEVEKIITTKREISNFDYCLSAVPFHIFKNFGVINNQSFDFEYSPILNVYLFLDSNPLDKPFYTLPNSIIHWIFNKGSFINITISDAKELIEKSKSDIEKIIKDELEKFLPQISSNTKRIIIVKEKKATFIPSIEVLNERPSSKTDITNLFLAGDWTDTKLPATIEGAIKSGRVAAEFIINNFHNS
jgi:squalene-associated FAD-dependent desaturase